MKDTQQRLLIEDLDYCNTVCEETKAISGGFFRKLAPTFFKIGKAVYTSENKIVQDVIEFIKFGV
jgi:hypothetical protein